jgi:hypothetical protein
MAIIFCTIVALGCSKTATIYKKDGAVIEAKIRRSDASSIYFPGCHNAERYNDRGRTIRVELHCDGDGNPEAVKTYEYNKDGRCTGIEMDICADGTVDRRLTFAHNKRLEWTESTGDSKADVPLDLDLVREASCPNKSPGNTPETTVARIDIERIEHPGHTRAIVSTVFGSIGVALIGLGIFLAEDCGDGMYCGAFHLFMTLPGGLMAVPSSIAAIWYWLTWSDSKTTAAQPEEPAGPKVTPVALTDGERTYYGLGLSWSW